MSGARGAGALVDRVGFQKLGQASDEAGGTISAFAEIFVCRAKIFHMRGGESVIAGRLEGRHTIIIRVRASADARTVTADWRVVDKRSGQVYAVRDVTPSDDRAYIDFLAESGVAT